MTTTVIEVIDLRLNNTGSITSALRESFDGDIRIIQDPGESCGIGPIVLPGTGNFGAATNRLDSLGFREFVRNQVDTGERGLLGICLGMQLLGTQSSEAPEARGLGILGFEVRKLTVDQDVRVPHVGWAEVEAPSQEYPQLLKAYEGRDFYFSHSYFVDGSAQGTSLITHHGRNEISASIIDLNKKVAGMQFHPEKSSSTGISLLREVLNLLR